METIVCGRDARGWCDVHGSRSGLCRNKPADPLENIGNRLRSQMGEAAYNAKRTVIEQALRDAFAAGAHTAIAPIKAALGIDNA